MKKLLFVFNPRSGKGHIETNLLGIIDIFTKAGYDTTVHPTQAPDDARKYIINHAKEYDRIVCSGGDGTINEVVTGMIAIDAKIPIGYIPAGSTNDFASSIGLPKNMKKAAEKAVSDLLVPIDMGQFGEKNFVYVAAFGAFTQVSYATSQALKNVLGHQAYVIEGFKQLANIKPIHMKITNDQENYEDDFIFGMVTNAKSVGGFKGLTGKHVRLDDGIFEVTLVKKIRNPIDLNSILSTLLGITKQCERVLSFKTSEIYFETETSIPWTIDGEFGGDLQTVCIRNLPKVVTMIPGKIGKSLGSDQMKHHEHK